MTSNDTTKSAAIVNRPTISSRTTAKSASSRLTLPTGASDSRNAGAYSSSHSTHNSSSQFLTALQTYLTRMLDFQQMDIQSALDQMKTLITTSPQLVYKTSYYRKQTKNHWARDDPAFCVLQILFLSVASVAYCIAFRTDSLLTSVVSFMFKSIVVNWLGSGIVMASVLRMISIQYLTVHQVKHVTQRVEWLYAWDIHCNAFFPLFLMLYVCHFFILPIVLGKSFLSLFISNTLFAAAFSYYFFITHLGYRSLPFLSNTEFFLFPIAVVLVVYALNLVGYPFGLGWNASRIVAHIYFD